MQGLQIGAFHAYATLDSGKKVELIFPEPIAMPSEAADARLTSDAQFLMAGRQRHSDLMEPMLAFSSGAKVTHLTHWKRTNAFASSHKGYG